MFKPVTIFVYRDGQEYYPYNLDAACEMIHKGQLVSTDHARIKGASEWKTLDEVIAESVELVEVNPRETSKSAIWKLPKVLCFIYLSYLVYQKQFVEKDPVMGGILFLILLFWGLGTLISSKNPPS